MESTFSNGDYVIIEKLSYAFGEPQRGEVIVFQAGFTEAAPSENSFYIKRIIGLPGETVRIRNGNVIVQNREYPQGKILSERYLDDRVVTRAREDTRVNLGSNEYFVMGDNRPNSSDSRIWGALKEKYIVGKPIVRVYPFDDFQIFTEKNAPEKYR